MIAPWLILVSMMAPPGNLLPAEPSIRVDLGASVVVVEVIGIDRANLDRLRQDADRFDWPKLLSVSLAGADAPSLPGKYAIANNILRFEPKYPIEPGLKHVVRFRPAHLPVNVAEAAEIRSEFTRPKPPKSAATTVVRVDPSPTHVPENLLKIYVHFSAPMSRGEVYRRVALIDESGHKVVMPFLELGEELWDSSGTRITLLLDPGRVKRGLKPREEEGPILEEGKSYTFVVEKDWPDAQGEPLREGYRKTIRTGPPIEARLDAKSWKMSVPEARTRGPLIIGFGAPLDRALLDRALAVHDASGRVIAGKIAIAGDDSRWQFQPDRPWQAGKFEVRVDPELEDLAGNNLIRPFEVDVQRPLGEDNHEPIILPFTIPSAGGK